jgi:hypothetical protein
MGTGLRKTACEEELKRCNGESCEGKNDVKGTKTSFRNDVSRLAPIINFDQLTKKKRHKLEI